MKVHRVRIRTLDKNYFEQNPVITFLNTSNFQFTLLQIDTSAILSSILKIIHRTFLCERLQNFVVKL